MFLLFPPYYQLPSPGKSSPKLCRSFLMAHHWVTADIWSLSPLSLELAVCVFVVLFITLPISLLSALHWKYPWQDNLNEGEVRSHLLCTLIFPTFPNYLCGIFLIDYIRPLLAFMFFRNLTESIFKRLKDNALTGLLLFTWFFEEF